MDTSATIVYLLRGDDRNVVEYTSCRDPDFNNNSQSEVASTWGGNDDGSGLLIWRIGGNSVSGICRRCHDK